MNPLLWLLLVSPTCFAQSQTIMATKNTVLTFDQAWQTANDACAGFSWNVESASKSKGELTVQTKSNVKLVIKVTQGESVVSIKVNAVSEASEKVMRQEIDKFFLAFDESL